MKKSWPIIFFAIMIFGCDPQEKSLIFPENVKIASVDFGTTWSKNVSGQFVFYNRVMNFGYEGDRIKSIGGTNFIYDNSGKLSYTRQYNENESSKELQRFSYKWKNGLIDEIHLDTLQRWSKMWGNLQLTDDFKDLEYAKFYYSNSTKPDSIVQLSSLVCRNTMAKQTLKFTWADENISSIKTNGYITPACLSPVAFSEDKEFTYGKNPNPYYFLYRQLGVLPDFLGFVVSKNCAVTKKVDGHTYDYEYEFNSRGLPVKIIQNSPLLFGKDTVKITYY